jgi:hypothetical protein
VIDNTSVKRCAPSAPSDLAHMIRKKRGRPKSTPPLFIEDCRQIRAADLARARGGSGDAVVCFTPEPFGTVRVSATSQPFGGGRAWLRCPTCGRRCGTLLLPPKGRTGCRVCLRARYLDDYPAHARWRHFLELLGTFINESEQSTTTTELSRLLAPRQRGIRRGRRVLVRGLRLWRRALLEQPDALSIIERAQGSL